MAIKKLKRIKPLKTIDKIKENPSSGRPSLNEKELTAEEKKYAALRCVGLPDDIVAKQMGLTHYLAKRYREDPRILEEIKYWQEVFQAEDINKWITMRDNLAVAVYQSLTEKIANKEVDTNTLVKLMYNHQIAVGMQPQTEPFTRTTKITEKTKKKIPAPAQVKPREITFEDTDIEDAEYEEEIERSIEEEESNK